MHICSLPRIENALPGRDGYEVEIFGMEGIPAPDVADYKRRKEIELGLSAGSISQPPPKRAKVENRALTEEELRRQLAEHKALMGISVPEVSATPESSSGAVYGAPQTYATPPIPTPPISGGMPLGPPPGMFPPGMPPPGTFPGAPFPPPFMPGFPPGYVYSFLILVSKLTYLLSLVDLLLASRFPTSLLGPRHSHPVLKVLQGVHHSRLLVSCRLECFHLVLQHFHLRLHRSSSLLKCNRMQRLTDNMHHSQARQAHPNPSRRNNIKFNNKRIRKVARNQVVLKNVYDSLC